MTPENLRRLETRASREARWAAKENRAQLDPDVALYRDTIARRAERPNPSLDAAKREFDAQLQRERDARKGGRQRRARTSSRILKPTAQNWKLNEPTASPLPSRE